MTGTNPDTRHDTEATTCAHGACITCSDEAVAVRVLELLDNGMARVDGDEKISIELVDAAVGDAVLVHAKVAIAKLLQPSLAEEAIGWCQSETR